MGYLIYFVAGVVVAAIIGHYESAFLVKELGKAEVELKSLRLAVRRRV